MIIVLSKECGKDEIDNLQPNLISNIANETNNHAFSLNTTQNNEIIVNNLFLI